jgi:predicted nucleotidyltransferase
MDMRWRQTQNLDLSLAASLEEYPARLDTLPGWSRDPGFEYRWLAPFGVKVDVIPAGSELLKPGELTWPRSGQRMSLLGFRLAFERAVSVRIRADLTVRVAPVPVVVVLKMVAYMDRPGERLRDLEDIGYVFEGFVGPDAKERYSDAVFDRGLTYEEVSPFLLGQEISAIVNAAEREAVERYLGAVENERDPRGTQAQMARLGPASWHRDPEQLLRRLKAFKQGFAA